MFIFNYYYYYIISYTHGTKIIEEFSDNVKSLAFIIFGIFENKIRFSEHFHEAFYIISRNVF